MTALAKTPGPLAGIRVVEMGQLIAGPFCGQLLGDMGAEVIKIEPPGSGDPMRAWGRGNTALWWEVIARNKKSVSIDLRCAEGQALARRLIRKADILVENFRPGTIEKWGLGPDVLRADNPGLIVVRMSGYGQSGPYADRAGFGLIGEAMGGWRYIVGEPDRPPARMGVSIGDSLCATFGCMGALAALHRRAVSGRGQIVDSSLYESVLQMMESLVIDYDVAGFTRERTGAVLPGIAPSNVYRCHDGEILIGANQDTVFRRLCEAMGRPGLGTDPRYATHEARGQRQTELDQLIDAWTQTFALADLEAVMAQHGVPAGRVYKPADMLADPQFKARGSIVELEHPKHGTVRMQGAFPMLSETPLGVRRLAPERPGQDNDEVLSSILDMDREEIKALSASRVI
ncbi:CoA transferase [Xanthobacter dioxanivorans]|uniref:CoA transferase n=1 Tax=Xanthobacter dioxanivorans TaxID=2528964 RepID=A0A974PP93_9HYPH|nr:CoA transferase [Xanthobacter dioxanivorans]QRG07247.1 CoA transferase [Xanthobacter dioxanivorans]